MNKVYSTSPDHFLQWKKHRKETLNKIKDYEEKLVNVKESTELDNTTIIYMRNFVDLYKSISTCKVPNCKMSVCKKPIKKAKN